MAFDINSFVIDRPVRGFMQHKTTDEVLFLINQIEDPSLTVNADTVEATDALGAPIMFFDRAKSCEFSASNSLLDLGLLAAQNGTAKQVAGTNNKISVVYNEEVKWVTGKTVTLKHKPTGVAGAEIPFIYKLNNDGTFGKKYTCAATAGEDKFKVDAATSSITPPTNVTVEERAFIIYTFEADGTENNGAVQVTGDGVNFPTAGKFTLEVLGADTCDISTKYYAYLHFPNAKMQSNFDLTLTTEGKHPFTIKCMQDYCDNEKKLFTLTVPET